MNRSAIYTSVVGSYDDIRQPLIIDERFDYVLFTDNVTVDRIGVWQVRPIPQVDGNYISMPISRLLHNMSMTVFLNCWKKV